MSERPTLRTPLSRVRHLGPARAATADLMSPRQTTVAHNKQSKVIKQIGL